MDVWRLFARPFFTHFLSHLIESAAAHPAHHFDRRKCNLFVSSVVLIIWLKFIYRPSTKIDTREKAAERAEMCLDSVWYDFTSFLFIGTDLFD